ncbi:MAG TPA: IS1595 family transposase [Acidobacteriaceae bacterium]|nr:IS1595 family transposase [Acidobacteriaceae bacterium]
MEIKERDDFPASLLEATRYFSDPDVCVEFMAAMRWPDGPVCPHCGGTKQSYLSTRRIWKCMNKECRKQFSVKSGTVFEDSPIALDKWLTAVWLVVNCKNGISSHEIARDLNVTQKSAWFMLHRIRLALESGIEKLGGPHSGPVEVDESFVGGNPKNWHAAKRVKHHKEVRSERVREYQNRFTHKTAIVGMLDRESRQIRAKVVPNVKRETLQNHILATIKPNTHVYTDQAVAYNSLADDFVHKTVNHAMEYVRGNVHTNGLENFWSLLKRNLRGTYVAVEPFHLDRYLAEQVFRFNNRRMMNDADRFRLAVSQISGKRLTYAELTGKVGETGAVA